MTPTGLPALAALSVGLFAFLLALVVARLRRERAGEIGGRRSWRSLPGIALQGASFAIVAIGPVDATLDPLATLAVGQGIGVAATMAQAVMLFAAATRAMGRNWSLVARTRGDHALVTAGPFAVVRHPIYVALFFALIALAIALGHAGGLLVGFPLFAIGTWLRVREEERLLHTAFGAAYDAYAQAVKRFVPGVF